MGAALAGVFLFRSFSPESPHHLQHDALGRAERSNRRPVYPANPSSRWPTTSSCRVPLHYCCWCSADRGPENERCCRTGDRGAAVSKSTSFLLALTPYGLSPSGRRGRDAGIDALDNQCLPRIYISCRCFSVSWLSCSRRCFAPSLPGGAGRTRDPLLTPRTGSLFIVAPASPTKRSRCSCYRPGSSRNDHVSS